MKLSKNCLLLAASALLLLSTSLVDAGSGGQELVCMEYRHAAGGVMWFRHRGFSQEQVIAGLRDELPTHFKTRMKWVIEEGYKWPRGDEDFQVYVFLECVKNRWQSSRVADHEVMDGRERFREAVRESFKRNTADFERAFMNIKGQKFECENTLRLAELIARDIREYGFTLEQLSFMLKERDQRTASDVSWCIEARQPLRSCVLRRCMEQHT